MSSLVAASHLCGGSIARATADHARHRGAWLAGRCLEAAQRRALRAVGAVVETVEGVNLFARGGQHDPLIPHRLRRLEPAPVPRTVPELVHRAGNGHQLHTALMDWREELHPETTGDDRRSRW